MLGVVLTTAFAVACRTNDSGADRVDPVSKRLPYEYHRILVSRVPQDVRDLAFATALAFGMALGGAISNSVMLWMLGFPLAFGSAIALGMVLLRATDLSTARRWARGFGGVLIFGGGFALSASAIFVDWPVFPGHPIVPVPLDATMLHGIGVTWLLRAAVVALGFHLLEPDRWRRAVVLFFLLSLVVPVKLVIWKALYEAGVIVLSA